MTEASAPQSEDAASITKKSKSNLAFAFVCIPKDRRADMVTFYAYCRLVDDIADDTELPVEEKRRQLDAWRQGLLHGFDKPTSVQQATVALFEKYNIDPELPIELIDGMEMDLVTKRYETWSELKLYCYRVASVVGIVSQRIVGCRQPESVEYWVALGYALQMVNIMRDVGKDYVDDDRIYLPAEEMERFGYTEEMLAAGVVDEKFEALMEFQYQRAQEFYQLAISNITAPDRVALRVGEAMRMIYAGILGNMRRDGYRVFDTDYKLSKLRMFAILANCRLMS
ncbi:MAG: phytoene synthase [Verrucomicrobiales bacterium]|jgi:phytoene synthase